MRIVIISLLSVILYANYYSIQFISAKKKVDAFYFLNKLRSDVRKFSFVYKTDSGFFTVRFLISKNKKLLKKIARKLPYSFVIVPDDKKKIKPYMSFKPEVYLKLIRLNRKKVRKVRKVRKVSKVSKVSKVKKELPAYILMDLYLYEYDKDKIKQMLKKVEPYQQVAGYYKLKEYKNLEDVIFKMKDKDASMYATYFEAIKNTQNYMKISLSNKNNLFYLDFKLKQMPFIADILSVQNVKKVILYNAKSYLRLSNFYRR
jgi:hypothetical protein